MSLVSCQKQEFQPNPEGTTITVNATVEDPIVTKTYVEELENAYAINWSESESMLAIAFNGNDANFASKESDAFTLSEDGTGVFTITSLPTADKTTVAGIYPSSAFVSDYENSESTKIPIELPASQKPENNSYDPNAYIMVARSTDLASIQESEVWNAYYYRASALNRFRIKNLINEGNIFSATITFSSATNAAGRRFFDLTTENPTPGEFYREGTTLNEIQLDYSDHLLATGTDGYDLWFTSWAVDLPTGESFTLSITTDNGYKYTKTFTAKQNVVLEENHLNLLTLDMTGVVPETTVTDYSGEYLIVSKNKKNTGKWVYMGDFNSSYYSVGNSQIDASKDFNTLSPRDFDNISGIENYIWIVSRTDDGYTLCNKSTGIYFKGDDKTNTAYQSDSPEFHTLSLSSEGDMRIFYNSTNRYLMYNSGSPRFACYTGTQNPIYLLKWVESTEPVLIVSENSKTVAADAAEVVFEYTARNLTGDVTATVTSDEAQIISGTPVVDAAASTVTVTLNPNTDEVEKTATITLSADGVEPVTLTITQRAKPAAGTKYYVKVTEEPADWSGNYIIVFEDVNRIYKGSLTEKFEGSSSIENYYDVAIDNNQIVATDDVISNGVAIENHSGSYAIKTASGYYISRKADTNGVDSAANYSSDCNVTINMRSDGDVEITGVGGRTMLYNKSADYIRFYSSSNIGNNNYPSPSLYRLSE